MMMKNNSENLVMLADTAGIELTPEQMEMVSGGRMIDWDDPFGDFVSQSSPLAQGSHPVPPFKTHHEMK